MSSGANKPEPADFITAAWFLNAESIADMANQEQLWADAEDARARSAVSRGYYAAFRVLKSRLIPARSEWRADPNTFPYRLIHEGIKQSLQAALGEKHRLVREMKALLYRRNRCDYSFQPVLTCAEADNDLAAAASAIELIRGLSQHDIDAIALELAQFAARISTQPRRD